MIRFAMTRFISRGFVAWVVLLVLLLTQIAKVTIFALDEDCSQDISSMHKTRSKTFTKLLIF